MILHLGLIRWGIVIHGFIDGYSRLVSFGLVPIYHFIEFQITGLKASTDNRSTTVLDLFLEAVHKHGMPSRIRGDCGSENIAVSIYMVMRNGTNCASFIWGS